MEVDPFPGLKLTNPGVLDSLEGRTVCPKCHKSRKYFCYNCYLPVAGLEHKLPRIKLPLKIDIIKHPNEVPGKSTSGHAVVLAPDDASIYAFPCIPDYDPTQDVLVFPCKGALTLEEFLRQRCGVDESNGTPLSPGSGQEEDSHVTSTATDTDSDSVAAKSSADKEKLEPSVELATDRSAEEPSLCTTAVDVAEADVDDGGKSQKGRQVTECTSMKEAAEANKITQEAEHGLSGSSGDAERNSGASKAEEVLESGSGKRKMSDADGEDMNRNGDALVPAKIPRAIFSARIPRVVFVDSTWRQTKSIVDDERLSILPRVELRSRTTKFWRSQQDLPKTCLSTIEAIYYFVCDYHTLTSPHPYTGQYDDLLLFFMSTYHTIHRKNKGVNIKAYNR